MSQVYRAVDWNRQKLRYDAILAAFVLGVVGIFLAVSALRSPDSTAETLILRSTSVASLVLLHIILSLGPLARLDSRFLPFLYNRRHLGVTMFVLALVHGALAIFQFHALGDTNPFVSVFTAYHSDYRMIRDGHPNVAHFPFEPFGLLALIIFFLMAATSHDFWLKNLGASVWKFLHSAVYLAYALVVAHVVFGVFQSERHWAYPVALGLGFSVVTALHLAAARKETSKDRIGSTPSNDGYVDVASIHELVEGRGKVVIVDDQRVALFLHQGRVFAISNVCRHQGGPLGEGRILDGCVTCPWHGWNYQPEDGCSPPPFQEVVPTYPTRVTGSRIAIRPRPNTLGTPCAGSPVNPISF
jgi:nitrite reductase/ring-hydroxylating ferredoxin subunit